MTLHMDVHGDGDAVMLLLHGMGATGAVWRRTTSELALV